MQNNNQMDKNILLFFLFSIIVFVIFGFLKQPPKEQNKIKNSPAVKKVKKNKQLEMTSHKESREKSSVNVKEEKTSDLSKLEKEFENEKGKNLSVETELFKAILNTKGGRIESLRLKNYKIENGKFFELIPPNFRDTHYFFLRFEIPESEKLERLLNKVAYDVSFKKDNVGNETVTFLFNKNGVYALKKITFKKDSYLISIKAEVKLNDKPVKAYISTTPGLTKDQLFPKSKYEKPPTAFYYDGSVERIKNEKMKTKIAQEPYSGNFLWCGVETKYFAAIFIPENSFNKIYIGHYKLNVAVEKENKELLLPFVAVPIDKKFSIFMGPKSYKLLEDYGKDLQKLVDFGFFSFIAKPIYYSLIFTHRYVSNWGFCILLISFIITLALFPLRIKQLNSMKDLQKIQPKIKAIQAKYKGAKSLEEKQKMQAELAKIYKETGTSPLATFGGCLPMILQIPVFFAFYKLLYNTVELWKQPFILWIKDLSTYDPTYIIPVLMGLSMIVQMRQTPSQMQDKNTKMMSYIMPIALTVIFLNLSSGVLLYYFSSNVFSSAFQKIYEKLTGIETNPKSPKASKKIKKQKK